MNDDIFSPTEPKRSIPVGQLVTGSVLVVVGLGWLMSALDVANIPWPALLAGVLIIIGIALTAAASQGAPHEGLVSAGITFVVILALLSTLSSAFSVPLRGGVGDRTYRPTAGTLEEEYRLVAGQLRIDLSDVAFSDGETTIATSVTFGKLVIDGIPDGTAVSVIAKASAGELVLFGSTWDGVGISQEAADGDYATATRRLRIEASVGFGQIEVGR